VRGTGGREDIGMIRIEFPRAPNSRDQNLEEVSWEEFFEKFDDSKLALVYQNQTAAGTRSNFSKLITREHSRARAASAGR
jgi:hypothetical protein